MVGPAILYLPHGLATSGYAFGIPIMLLATFSFLFSAQCLLDSWKLEHIRLLRQVQAQQRRRESRPNGKGTNATIDEGSGDEEQDERKTEDTALLDANTSTTDELHHHQRTFFLSYPELAYRALGVRFEQLVKLGISLMQSCVCLTYLIFVPQNLSSAVHLLWNVQVAPEWFLILMIAVQVPLSWIRDIRKLTVTNLLANVLILYGLIVCVALALKEATSITTGAEKQDGQVAGHIQTIVNRFESLTPFGKDWFLFIGTSVSAKFENVQGSVVKCFTVLSVAVFGVATSVEIHILLRPMQIHRSLCLKGPLPSWCRYRRLSLQKKIEKNSPGSIATPSSVLSPFTSSSL
jgi:hypothetical protein